MIVGIDPGVTTGLVAVKGTEIVDASEDTVYGAIANFIDRWRPEVVIVEDYILGPRPGLAKPAIKVLGVVEYLCQQRHIPLIVSSPAILRGMLPRVKGSHPSRHVRSAYAHVLKYALSRRAREG